MIKKTIKIPIYNDEIILLVGDIHESAKYLDDRFSGLNVSSYLDGWTLAYFCELVKPESGVSFPHLLISETASDYIVYHESLHAAFNILDMVGVKNTPDNHESLAYLQGYIAEQIIKLLNKIK